MAKKKASFEDSLRELEQIAEKIEGGEIGLEESITQYEKGMALVKHCREILGKAELRIQKLQESENGSAETTDMSVSTDE
ncbi:MAG: exodeoxyribonuclease VII small subunit [Phycisphaerae bacterium]